MKKMSIETMENIISYVDLYFCDKHTTPSVNEIALGVGIPAFCGTQRPLVRWSSGRCAV